MKIKLLLKFLIAGLLIYFATGTFILNRELWKLKAKCEDLYQIAGEYEAQLDELTYTFSNLNTRAEKEEILKVRKQYVDSMVNSSIVPLEYQIPVDPKWDRFHGFNHELNYDFTSDGQLKRVTFERQHYDIEEIINRFYGE